MGRYIVNTQFTFYGTLEVEADNKAHAKEIIMTQCGLVMNGNIHTTLDNKDIDWAFDPHPRKKIGRITKKR